MMNGKFDKLLVWAGTRRKATKSS